MLKIVVKAFARGEDKILLLEAGVCGRSGGKNGVSCCIYIYEKYFYVKLILHCFVELFPLICYPCIIIIKTSLMIFLNIFGGFHEEFTTCGFY